MSKRDPAEFFFLPRELAEWPPIRHRHSDPNSTDVWPFEFGIAAGVLTVARLILAGEDHKQALAVGAKSIEQEKVYADQYREDWKQEKRLRRLGGVRKKQTPERQHTFSTSSILDTPKDHYNNKRPMPLKQTLKKAGKYNYEARSKALKKQPAPETITVEISRYALLHYARLSDDGANVSKVEAALDRLLEPVGNMLTPLLQGWSYLDSGHLQLQVAGTWLNPRFVELPLSLPLRSPTALAILMFLMTIVNRAGKFPREGKMPFKSLCTRLGIPTRHGNKVMIRTVDNALAVLNAYLENVDCKLEYIELRSLPGDYVCFQQGDRPQAVTEDEDEEAAEPMMIYQNDDGSFEDADGNPVDEYGTPLDAADDGESAKTESNQDDDDQQVETKPRPGGPRPRIELIEPSLSDEELRVKEDREYLNGLLGPDAAKMSDNEVTSYVDRMLGLADDQRHHMERYLRHETERKARLAMHKANIQE
jgi:hypothetical protein